MSGLVVWLVVRMAPGVENAGMLTREQFLPPGLASEGFVFLEDLFFVFALAFYHYFAVNQHYNKM